MSGKDVALLLSFVGFLMSAYGLVLAVRAIWEETHRRDLRPGWRNALEGAQHRARSLLRRPKSQTVVVGGIETAVAVGNASVTVTDAPAAAPQTVEELTAYVNRQLAQVRDAITAQANDAASRIDALNVRVTDGLSDVTTRLEEAERASAEIDSHTLDREMWGLLWVAGGSLLQAVALFVGR